MLHSYKAYGPCIDFMKRGSLKEQLREKKWSGIKVI